MADSTHLLTNSSAINKTQPSQPTVGVSSIDVTAIAEFVAIAFVIIFVNSLVFILFLKTKTLRSPANYILLSLAISDFLTGLLNIPLYVIVVHTPIISSSELSFRLGFLVPVVHVVTAISSSYHIYIATLEKYLSIAHPVSHRLIRKGTVKAAILLVWLVAAFLGFLPFIWIDKALDSSGKKYFVGYLIFCLVAVFALPYSFMLYAFVTIFRTLSARLQRRSKYCSHPQKLVARERKCMAIFVTMAVVFAVCWLPYFLLMLLLLTLDLNTTALETAAHAIILIRYMTSIINPLLYSLLRPDFNAAAKRLLKKAKCYCIFRTEPVIQSCTPCCYRKQDCSRNVEEMSLQKDQTETEEQESKL